MENIDKQLATPSPSFMQKLVSHSEPPLSNPTMGIQTKLNIGKRGDQYEQEADQIADRVMSMPEPANHQVLQRQGEGNRSAVQMHPVGLSMRHLVQRQQMQEKEGMLQAKASPAMESYLAPQKGEGNPLRVQMSKSLESSLMAATTAGEKANRKPQAQQDISAGVTIKLVDERWLGNLGGDGLYTINPRITARLGQNLKQIGNPIVNLGDQLLGSHVQLGISNSATNKSVGAKGYEYIRFKASYTLKNAKTWKTPNITTNLRIHNQQQVRIGAGGKLPMKLVNIEGSGQLGSSQELKAAVSEFNVGGTDQYFAHQHTVVIFLSATGVAQASVEQSTGVGGKKTKEVYVERTCSGHSVASDGRKYYTRNQLNDKKQMPLQK
jgi:hypothetical protein